MRRLGWWALGLGLCLVWFITVAPVAPLRQSAGIALSSNVLTGQTVVKSVRGGLIHSVTLMCGAATTPCEVAIYDVTALNPALTVAPVWEARTAVANSTVHAVFEPPLITTAGIEVEMSGTGPKVTVTYE